jgi:shikimate dehydrogenase
MKKLVGIFGYPLGHSISPAFQQAAFDYYGLDVEYQPWSTPPENLGREVGKLRGERFLGANVTVPHKVHVFDFLDGADTWATTIGAVNTIVREDSRLVGYNTDAYGFIKPLREQGEFEPHGKNALLLGSGGAARAAAFALASEGVSSLVIANRTVERAESLAKEVRAYCSTLVSNGSNRDDTRIRPSTHESPEESPRIEAISLGKSSLEKASQYIDLIVNATSMGMKHSPMEARSPLEARMIPASALVYDMVYNPPDTPLLIEAGRAGAKILGGLPMLVYQGAAAFEKWTGREAPIGVMFNVGERTLRRLAV